MGLCIAKERDGLGRTKSMLARTDLKVARAKDILLCAPVFEVLALHKSVQKQLLNMYEHTNSGGRGSVKYFMEQIRATKDMEHYLTRSLCFFNKGGRSFTAPQFCLLIWNLLTLQHNADGAAEWSFRVWFGGFDYSVEAIANRQDVFEMLDSSLGLTAKVRLFFFFFFRLRVVELTHTDNNLNYNSYNMRVWLVPFPSSVFIHVIPS